MIKKPTKTKNWKKVPKGKELETIAKNIQEAFSAGVMDNKESPKKSKKSKKKKEVAVEVSDKPKERPLTQKELRFIDEYMIDLNATQAAIRAGYSKKTANEIGYENMIKPRIRNIIRQKQLHRQVNSSITADMIIKELIRIGFSDVKDVVNWNGWVVTPKNADELTEDQTAAISEMVPNKFGVKIKMHDKVAALEKLGKHLGIFTDTVNLVTKIPINVDVTNLTPEQAAEVYKNALKE